MSSTLSASLVNIGAVYSQDASTDELHAFGVPQVPIVALCHELERWLARAPTMSAAISLAHLT